jgi:glucokinase
MVAEHLILAGDIGGTKTHLALFTLQDKKLELFSERTFASKQYPGLEPMLEEFLDGGVAPIARACFGIAGPVVDGAVRTANLPWVIEASTLARQLDLPAVALLNDLEAAALGIFTLEADEFICLHEGTPRTSGNKALIAAGTGLGEALLYDDGHRYHPIASEGGHADFAPREELEIGLLRFLIARFGHVSCERVVSGPGIMNIYDFLRQTGASTEPPPFAEQLAAASDPSALISQAALSGEPEICVKTLEVFAGAYGAAAGNLALRGKATAGVYIGGGIAPKIKAKLTDGAFLRGFVEKGRYKEFVSAIPVYLILNEKTALQGAAYNAAFRSGE